MTRRRSDRRVVVTGLGAVTSLGDDVAGTWKAILAGSSGVGRIHQFDSEDFPVRIGSEVDLDRLPAVDVAEHLRPYVTRSVRLGAWALREAWRDAGIAADDHDPWRTGLLVGASNFPVIEEDDYAWPVDALRTGDYREQYLAICEQMPELLDQRQIGMVSTLLASNYPIHGPCTTIQSACASATQAIGEALQMIRDGDLDVAVAGGADSMLSAVCVTGFTLLRATSMYRGDPAKACRPFDQRRDGLVLGEGAGLLVLEDLTHARRRDASIHAEVVGYGSSCDGYRFTDSHPQGLGPIRCMSAALADAGLEPSSIDYINAHGTSTPQNDRVEALAIAEVFGPAVSGIPVSSTKSQIGHLLCAAGGIEAVVTIMALKDGIVPPTINLEHPDPDCRLDLVGGQPRPAALHTALSNSFGFGGQNASLILRRWDGG